VASPREIRRRIRSVRNTAQITRAMEMVAAATIFMALVICCVFFTLRMRLRKSMVLGILSSQLSALSSQLAGVGVSGS
jgi:hypothetical protein